MEHDPEVHAFLRRWDAPVAPADMDARMMTRYHSMQRPQWRRVLQSRLVIPLPVAAAAVMLAMAWWGYQTWDAVSFRRHMNGFQPVAAPIIEVAGAAQ
jgi:hypothetical protein